MYHYCVGGYTGTIRMNSQKVHLSFSSLQCELFSPAESSSTPESCRSLKLRIRSLRGQFADCRAEQIVSKESLVRLQPASLQKNTENITIKTGGDKLQWVICYEFCVKILHLNKSMLINWQTCLWQCLPSFPVIHSHWQYLMSHWWNYIIFA